MLPLLPLLAACTGSHVAAGGVAAGTTAVPPPQEVRLDVVHSLDEASLMVLLTAPSDRPRVVNFWATWRGQI